MNTIKIKNLIFVLFIALLAGCSENENPISKNAKEGGLIEIKTGTVVYFINTMDQDYPVELKYYQGVGADISTIDVYRQFFTIDDTGAVISSPKTLFKTLDLTGNKTPGYITYNTSFQELADGTTINGVLIPQSDDLLKPGFYWELTYDIKMEDGRHLKVNANTVFINSRFAGVYNVIKARYYRAKPTVVDYDETYWPETVTITALNANTFKIEAPCEPFGTNTIYFTLDEASGAIQVLKSYAGSTLIINSLPFATCSTEPGAFNNVPCDGSNIAIKVPSTKDTIKITYGYVNATTGPREFYQVMVKQ